MATTKLEQALETVRVDKYPELDPVLVQEVFKIHFQSSDEDALIRKTRQCLQNWVRSELDTNND